MATLKPYARLSLCPRDPELRVDTTAHVENNTPSEIILTASEHGIGRNTKPADSPPGQDWSQITLEWVSGRHCIFKALEPTASEPLTVTLTDLSSNGTYVNGTKLVKGTASALRHGDKIHIFKPKTKKAMDQLILYELEMLEPGSSSARAEAWRKKSDGSNSTIVADSSNGNMVEQAQRHMAKLTRTNDGLRIEINDKQTEIDELARQVQDYKQEISKIKCESESHITEEVSRLKGLLQEAQGKLDSAETVVLELKSEVSRLENEGANVSSRHEDAALQIKSLKEEAAAMEQRHTEQAAVMRKLREENAGKDKVITEMQDELGPLRELAKTNESLKADLMNKLETVELKLKRQLSANEELAAMLEGSNKKLKTLNDRELATQEKLRDFEAMKEDLEERSASLKRQKVLYSETVSKLEAERDSKEKLSQQVQEAERKLALVERNGDSAEQVKALDAQLTAVRGSEKTLKKQVSEAQDALESLQFELEVTKRHLKSAELAADASREQCSALQLRLAQAGTALRQLDSMQQRYREDWADITSRMSFQLVALDQSTDSTSLTQDTSKQMHQSPVKGAKSLPCSQQCSEEEMGCTQMDSPMKHVKRRFEDTLDNDSCSDPSKKRLMTDTNAPQTQVGELEDDVNEADEATQYENGHEKIEEGHEKNEEEEEEEEEEEDTQAELLCSRKKMLSSDEQLAHGTDTLIKSLSNDAQVDSSLLI